MYEDGPTIEIGKWLGFSYNLSLALLRGRAVYSTQGSPFMRSECVVALNVVAAPASLTLLDCDE